MIRPTRRAGPRRRPGYFLVEFAVASILAALLASLLGLACVAFARPALEVEARARIAQEATLIAQSLACDLGGYLADPAGRTGDLSQYAFLDWDLSYGGTLLLNYQGAGAGEVIVVTYQLQGDQLVRSDSATGRSTTIARHVAGFAVAPDPDDATRASVQVTVAYRYFTGTYTFFAVSPP